MFGQSKVPKGRIRTAISETQAIINELQSIKDEVSSHAQNVGEKKFCDHIQKKIESYQSAISFMRKAL